MVPDIVVNQSPLAVYVIVGLIGLAAAIGVAFAIFSVKMRTKPPKPPGAS